MEYDGESKNWVVTEKMPSGVIEIWPNKARKSASGFGRPKIFQQIHACSNMKTRRASTAFTKAPTESSGCCANTSWNDSKYSANEHGSGMIVKIFGSTEPFDFAKSVYTVADCISVASDNKSALILDFFAGSGTTFHSTALLSPHSALRECNFSGP